MTDKVARLRAHQRNMERYESLLKSDVGLQFLEKRLSEQRLALAMLEFMRSSAASHEDLASRVAAAAGSRRCIACAWDNFRQIIMPA